MTWLIRVENPDMESPNRILHGELCNKVSKIFEEAGQKVERVGVSWVEPEKKAEDPYYGQKLAMTMWLHEQISSRYDDLIGSQPSLIGLTRVIRDEWMDERGYKGKDGKPYIQLREYREVAKQVLKGWGF